MGKRGLSPAGRQADFPFKMKRKKLVEIFGDRVVCNLFTCVKDGSISKFNLKKMAEEMEVIQAYNVYRDRDPFDSMEAFDYILDQWCKNELFKYTESKKAALGRLLEVLKNSLCENYVIHSLLEEPTVRLPISQEDELSQLIYSTETDDDLKK